MIKLNRIQYRIWLDGELQSSKTAYNICLSSKIKGKLRKDLLRQSLNIFFQENETFHSIIATDREGYPYWDTKDSFDLPLAVIPAQGLTDEKLISFIEEKGMTPFDLKKDFPCRFYLLETDTNEFIFLTVFHHCLIDGHGILLFSERLSQIYNSLIRGVDVPTSQAPSAETVNKAVNEALNAEQRMKGANEIANYLHGVPLVTPVQRIEGNTKSRRGQLQFKLGEDLLSRCDNFCKDNHYTLFRLFCASWGVTLCRMLGTESLVLDHAVDVRNAASSNAISIAVNNQPLLIDISGGLTAGQLLDAVKESRRLLKRNVAVDYIDLMHELRANGQQRSDTTPNLLINYPLSSKIVTLNLDGCQSENYHHLVRESSEMIGLHLYDDKEGTCQIMYQECVPRYFIEELAATFSHILTQMVKEDKNVYSYELVSHDRQQCIAKVNEVRPFHIGKNLLEQIRSHSTVFAGKTAIKCGPDSLTYSEFESLTNRIASLIRKEKPAAAHFRVAIYKERNIYTIPTIVGALKAGATYIPIDQNAPKRSVEHILEDSRAQLLITDRKSCFIQTSCKCMHIEDIIETADSPSLDCVPEMPSMAYIIYTSGTTGHPKATPLSSLALHQLIDNILHHNKWLDASDVVLQMASISFDASVVDIFSALYVGSTIVMATAEERKDTKLLFSLLKREKVSFATIPPAIMTIVSAQVIPAMKTLVFAGEATPKEVFDRWQGKGIRLVNAYGPTENCVCSTFSDVGIDSSPSNIGKPLRNVSCYVLDDNMHLVPFGVTGELYIGGNQLTDGYLNQDELNAQKFLKNPFATDAQNSEHVNQTIYKTGDMVYLKPDYSIEFLGRSDFQAKVNGYRIELEGIESMLVRHPLVQQAVCTVEEDGNGHKQLTAYIEMCNCEEDKLTVDQLRSFLAEHMQQYAIPARWYFVEHFNLTANGKIDRVCLPSHKDIKKRYTMTAFEPPATASEHILTDIFARILEVDNISVTADLFDEFGLESVMAMTAVYEAKNMGVDLSVSSLYKNRTIRASLQDHKLYPYYWLNECDDDKPVLILACGLVYLRPYHDDLLELLGDRYNILILDSIHEYFYMKKECTFRSLLDNYMRVLPQMLKGKRVLGTTGWCIGAEIALQLAVELKQAHIASPIVFSLDGYLHQGMEQKAPLFAMNFPDVPEEVNRERDRIKDEFINSTFFRPYSGKVYCFFANQFSKYPPNGEILSDEEVEFNYKCFKNNPSDWLRLQPGCITQFLDDNHYYFLQKKNMIEVVKVMDKELQAFNNKQEIK